MNEIRLAGRVQITRMGARSIQIIQIRCRVILENNSMRQREHAHTHTHHLCAVFPVVTEVVIAHARPLSKQQQLCCEVPIEPLPRGQCVLLGLRGQISPQVGIRVCVTSECSP